MKNDSINYSFEQEEALQINLSVIVEAGAGSGKTAILVERYLRLLSHNPRWDVSHIVAITFTQKAADDMLSRIQSRLLHHHGEHWAAKALSRFSHTRIGTIHSFCAQLLRQYPIQAHISPTFSILDDVESRWLWTQSVTKKQRQWATQHNSFYRAYLTQFAVTQLLDDLLLFFGKRDHNFDQFTQDATSLEFTLNRLFQDCLSEYTVSKRQKESMDFIDLLQSATTLITEHPLIGETIQSTIKAMMIDEFQDTDRMQWAFLSHISGLDQKTPNTSKNVLLVGDPKQSIYGFRGISPQLFLDTRTQFLNAITLTNSVTLRDNYRTSVSLMDILNPLFESVFESDESIDYTPMIAQRATSYSTPEPLPFTTFFYDAEKCDHDRECTYIANWILEQKSILGCTWSDFAILFRKKKDMNAYEIALNRKSIPSRVSQATVVRYESHWALLNLCEFLVNPEHDIAGLGVLRQLGSFTDDTVYQLYRDCDAAHLCDKLGQWAHLPESLATTYSQHAQITRFIMAYEHWKTLAKEVPLSQVILSILPHWGAPYFADSAGILLFIHTVMAFEARPFEDNRTLLSELTYWVENYPGKYHQNNEDQVQLMTIHSAKGLEFKGVVIAECGVGIQTHSRSKRTQFLDQESSDMRSEEKRLFYVACTRARDSLLLVGHVSDAASRTSSSRYCDFIPTSYRTQTPT